MKYDSDVMCYGYYLPLHFITHSVDLKFHLFTLPEMVKNQT